MTEMPERVLDDLGFLEKMLRGECGCLRSLLTDVKDRWRASSAGLVVCRGGEQNVFCDVPFATHAAKYFSVPQVKQFVDNVAASGDIERPNWVWGFRCPGQHNGTPIDLSLTRIANLHPSDQEAGCSFVFLVNRLIYDSPIHALAPYHDMMLASAVRVWASHVVHLRMELNWMCERLLGEGGDVANRSALVDSLRHTVWQLRRMLSLDDIIRLDEALRRNEAPDVHRPGELPRMLQDVAGNDHAELRLCVPPQWPPDCCACDRKGGVSRDLIGWVPWRNIASLEVGSKSDSHRKLAFLLKRLPARAAERVKPQVNLLPCGLQNFVLSRGRDPWVTERLKFWQSGGASKEELARAVTSLARVVHHVVGGLAFDERTFQSLIWLISEYGHNALGIPGQVDLRAHMLHAARGEPALHALKTFYRDHFFHAMEVCFLGHFLLETKMAYGRSPGSDRNRGISQGMALWELVAARMALPGGKRSQHQAVLRLWYVASLLHDVGYGIDVLKGAQALLRFLSATKPLAELRRHLEAGLGRLSEDLEIAGLSHYTAADKPGEDHGVIAAWHLEHLLRKASVTDSTLDSGQYGPAVRAIALHNSRKHRVSFARDPLAFLLIVCDSIQEWHRPKVGFAVSPGVVLTRMFAPNAYENGSRKAIESVQVNVTPGRGLGSFALKSREPLRLTLTFNDEVHWNSGVFNLWLDASCNFQRLDFQGLPRNFDVEIEYRTPVFVKEGAAAGEQQLHRLRNAAQETHMTFLDRWFPELRTTDGGRITNGGVTWRPGEPGKSPESLTLHLRRLSQMKPITGDVDEFRRRLVRWKRYNEDREFGGDYAAPEAV